MTTDDERLIGGLVLFVLMMAILVAVAGTCSAQVERPVDLDRSERALALGLARVAFNEALDSEADLELIVQVVFAARATPERRMQWLRDHSPCVSGRLTQDQAYQRPGNCRWTRNLVPDARRPRGWDRELHGRWGWIRERWTAHLARAVEYVRGTRVASICEETPTTWDGRRYGADLMTARGYRILECREQTQNFALVRRGRS